MSRRILAIFLLGGLVGGGVFLVHACRRSPLYLAAFPPDDLYKPLAEADLSLSEAGQVTATFSNIYRGICSVLQLSHSRGDTGVMARPAVDITKLTPAERLQLVEELWDSLCDTPEAVPLTEAQRAELDRRLDDLEQEGPSGIPWDEVVRKIRRPE